MDGRNKPSAAAIVLLVVALAGLALTIVYVFAPFTALSQILTTTFGFAQILAFPVTLGAVVSIAAAVWLVIRLATRGLHTVAHSVSTLTCSVVLVCGLLLLGAGQTYGHQTFSDTADATTVYATFNCEGELTSGQLGNLIIQQDAQVIVLPEFGGTQTETAEQRIDDLLTETGLNPDLYQVFTNNVLDGPSAMTVVIAKSYGTYDYADDVELATTLGTLVLAPVDSTSLPDIAAVHTYPPLPTAMDLWRYDLEAIAQYCEDNPDAVVLGDFNATMRQGALAGIDNHTDALACNTPMSDWDRGTWPAQTVLGIRTSIDHILVPDDKNVSDVQVVNLGLSDHLAVVAKLS